MKVNETFKEADSELPCSHGRGSTKGLQEKQQKLSFSLFFYYLNHNRLMVFDKTCYKAEFISCQSLPILVYDGLAFFNDVVFTVL